MAFFCTFNLRHEDPSHNVLRVTKNIFVFYNISIFWQKRAFIGGLRISAIYPIYATYSFIFTSQNNFSETILIYVECVLAWNRKIPTFWGQAIWSKLEASTRKEGEELVIVLVRGQFTIYKSNSQFNEVFYFFVSNFYTFLFPLCDSPSVIRGGRMLRALPEREGAWKEISSRSWSSCCPFPSLPPHRALWTRPRWSDSVWRGWNVLTCSVTVRPTVVLFALFRKPQTHTHTQKSN